MPSVGMRHTTKAFLPKSAEIACYKSNAWRKVTPDQDFDEMADMEIDNVGGSEKRKFKNVYNRKRRRATSQAAEEDRFYGAVYTRKKLRLRMKDLALWQEGSSVFAPGATLDVIIQPSPASPLRFTRFFVVILKFIRSEALTFQEFAAFICCEPIAGVYARHGIHFKPGFLPMSSFGNGSSTGFCRIFGDQASIPLFWLDFPAVPLSFVNLHAILSFRSLYHPYHRMLLWTCMSDLVNLFVAGKNVPRILPFGIYYNRFDGTISINSCVKMNGSELNGRGFELDCGRVSTTLTFGSFRKKRSSLNSKRPNTSLSMGLQHFNANVANNKVKMNLRMENYGGLDLSKFRTIRSRRSPSATVKSSVKQTNVIKRNMSQNDKEAKSALVGLGQNMDSAHCSANVLVTKSDRCYREEGLTVTLDCSTSKFWLLVVKAHGSVKYIHRALDAIKPCSTNPYNHASIWTSDEGWMLEFCNRNDWLVFKDLYEKCTDRNIEVSSAKKIPVPGVREVMNYDDGGRVLFLRPDSYITTPCNEVARALARKTTIYEIGQDDEEWLEKLKSEFLANDDSEAADYLSAEKFEEIIDIFERTAYGSHGDSIFTECFYDMGRFDIIDTVYEYWVKKRKQKGSALLRVFEHQPVQKRRSPGQKRTVCRKKRSATWYRSQNGRNRQQPLVEDEDEFDAEQYLIDETKALEAREVANIYATAAIAKRKVAQTKLAIADRMAYLAYLACMIAAERAQIEESSEAPGDLPPEPSE